LVSLQMLRNLPSIWPSPIYHPEAISKQNL
jgi:hypothetical protein